jgi:hypothetical protein
MWNKSRIREHCPHCLFKGWRWKQNSVMDRATYHGVQTVFSICHLLGHIVVDFFVFLSCWCLNPGPCVF